jgi:hypothetical protein
MLLTTSGEKTFRKPRRHLRILGARKVIQRKFHREDPDILGATIQNLVTSGEMVSTICAPLLMKVFVFRCKIYAQCSLYKHGIE